MKPPSGREDMNSSQMALNKINQRILKLCLATQEQPHCEAGLLLNFYYYYSPLPKTELKIKPILTS